MDTLMLTGWQRRRLEQQLRTATEARRYRRTLAVLEVARTLVVTPRSVDHWVDAYGAEHHPAALREGTHTGRPPLWTQEHQACLGALRGQAPQDLDYAATDWTVPLRQEH